MVYNTVNRSSLDFEEYFLVIILFIVDDWDDSISLLLTGDVQGH